MTKKTKLIINSLLSIVLITMLLSGCSHKKDPVIVTINEGKLYLKDFYYDIYLIEKDGNQLEEDYQNKLGYSYWDSEYNGITIRQAAKSSIFASVVMYEILSDQAAKNGMTLSEEDLKADEGTADQVFKDIADNNTDMKNLNIQDLKDAIDKKTLGDKYRSELIKNFKIDKEEIRSSIKSEDYDSQSSYEQAVTDAVNTEEDRLFSEAYNKMKDQYDIKINFDNWDTVIIGQILYHHSSGKE